MTVVFRNLQNFQPTGGGCNKIIYNDENKNNKNEYARTTTTTMMMMMMKKMRLIKIMLPLQWDIPTMILFWIVGNWNIGISQCFPNQAGSCAGVGGSIHDRVNGLTVLSNSHMLANRQTIMEQNQEMVVDGSSPVRLEFVSDDPFKGVLIRVEQVYSTTAAKDNDTTATTNNTTTTTTTTTTRMQQQQQSLAESTFELQPGSQNVQPLDICWNPLVQAISHKNPTLKQSVTALLSVHMDVVHALPMIFAIDVTIVMTNNASVSSYGVQTYRLRLDPSIQNNTSSSSASSSVSANHWTDLMQGQEPNNNNNNDDDANSDHSRTYPDFTIPDTTTTCQLCSKDNEKVRYPNSTVRWENGTDILCSALETMSLPTPTCRIAQERIQDGNCGGCYRTCSLPCEISPHGTLPIQGQTLDCSHLTESLEALLSIRSCALSQALVRAHCGCHGNNKNHHDLETTTSTTTTSSSSSFRNGVLSYPVQGTFLLLLWTTSFMLFLQ